MARPDYGNIALLSTVASTTANGADPSTATICAEISGIGANENVEVRYIAGGATGTIWLLEHCTSSGLGSTAISHQTRVFTGSNQSAEYVLAYRTGNTAGARFRIRNASTFTGAYGCDIQAVIFA